MKNKREQTFCTDLGTWLKTHTPRQSMLIEVKIANSDFFYPDHIRKSQVATLNRLLDGYPIVHKISDGGVGSKLVDMIYLSPLNKKLRPFVAIKFKKSGKKYLVPWSFMGQYMQYPKVIEHTFSKYEI